MNEKNKTNQPSTKPKRINKYYWLDKGYEMVNGGLERAREQITSIKNYINGLLAVYVLATVIDAIYIEIDAFWKLLIVMLPVLVVKWAVYYGEISTLPEVKSFYPDSAQSSEEAYYQYLSEAQKHIKKLKSFAFNSTIILLSVLVLVTWWTVKSKTSVAHKVDELKIVTAKLKDSTEKLKDFRKKDIYGITTKLVENQKIFLEATIPNNELIEFKVVDKRDSIIIPRKQFLIGNKGVFHYNFTLKDTLKQEDNIIIYIEYQLTATERRLIEKLVFPSNKGSNKETILK